MLDREKVITHLHIIHTWAEFTSECDLQFTIKHLKDIAKWTDDALVLLKEQETTSTVESRLFHCEKCGYGVDDIYLSNEHDFDVYPHYCPNCGRSVKWE